METLGSALGIADEVRPPTPRTSTRRSRNATLSIEDDVVLRAYRAYRQEAMDARRSRIRQNERNLDAYLSHQDFSDKIEGQSAEFLPKTLLAVEQFTAFAKRALTDFAFFRLTFGVTETGVTDEAMQKLLAMKLDTLSYGQKRTNFATTIADGLKIACLESLAILKVYSRYEQGKHWVVEQTMGFDEAAGALVEEEELVQRETRVWHLCVDPVSPHGYFPDPTGRGLYEIHEEVMDLWQVEELAEQGEFDREAVAALRGDYARDEDIEREARHRGQDEVASGQTMRQQVRVGELWGTLLDSQGHVVVKHIVCTVANGTHVIRKPRPNPRWDGESPFVVAPIVRLPFSVWHKALFDEAVQLNLALNELANLMLDGGIEAVWGTRQVRADWLEDPEQVAGGLPQGATLFIKSDVPVGGKVVENTAEGTLPDDALAVFQLFEREFQAASLSNDLSIGQLPGKDTTATEILESQQGRSSLLDGIVGDIDSELIERALRKAFLTMLQDMEQVPAREVVETIGEEAAYFLARMTPAQRFAAFASGGQFRVDGLSGAVARARDFRRYITLLDLMSSNPLLAQAFAQKYSLTRFFDLILRAMNVATTDLALSPEEQAQQQAQAAAGAGAVGQGPAPLPPQLEGLLGGQGQTTEGPPLIPGVGGIPGQVAEGGSYGG